ncbi:MAG TPA: N-6 DNA methylase [Gemmatimonadaceae bacterium]
METLERAADLLRKATSLGRLAEILRELGFSEAPLALDDSAIARLGLPSGVREVRIASGVGALRCLAVELDRGSELRDSLSRVANALAKNSSQLLWLVVAIRESADDLAILCSRSTSTRTRVASLICQRNRIMQSDAETFCTLAAVSGESDLLTHARWLDVLGREAITNRFFRALEKTVEELAMSLTGKVARDERRELALLYVSRLVFLSFLETKGWLNGDFSFLVNGYAGCLARGGRYQKLILEPLFFGTLNTRVNARSQRARDFGRIPFLNGGLFSRSHLEKRLRANVFTDESFGDAFGCLLSRYRFSGRETTADWSEASIDPEILGKAFEALMASVDRKKSGAFYTPQELVEELTSHALASALGEPSDSAARLKALTGVRVIDPACGSGAFLVHTLERLASLRRDNGERGSIAEIRRRVLTSSIFGVDLNPMAVWLCELRLWLSIVIESDEHDPMKIAPLPNLDRNIRVGDSLAGGAFDHASGPSGSRKITALRVRYMRATGPRKLTLARTLDRAERGAAIDVLARTRLRITAERREMLISARASDLFATRTPPNRETRLRLVGLRREVRDVSDRIRALQNGAALPFSFGAHFSDVSALGGFDIVIGNPPWVRVHRIAQGSRQRLRQEFTVYRRAAWESGAQRAGAGRGFAAQIDMAALFVERGCGLLRPAGTLAYLLPSKLWRSLAGGGVRELLLERTDLVLIEDLADLHSQFDAAVYPSLLVARRRFGSASATTQPASPALRKPARVTLTIKSALTSTSWRSLPHRLPLDESPGSPWLLLPSAVRAAFDAVARASTPFSESIFGRPLLGVKTGCNDAYLVRLEEFATSDIARVRSGDRMGEIEREMLRPAIRGESLSHWTFVGGNEYLLWPHASDGSPRQELPPLARRWLAPYRDILIRRTDLHPRSKWWAVFRTESAKSEAPRVIWADFGLKPRALVVRANEPLVALNTCYVVGCRSEADAHALAAILNGPLAAAWLNAVAEPARGGYHRYLGWTMSMLPLPKDWDRARQILAPLGERGMQGDPPSDHELLDSALAAYHLDRTVVQALLMWGTGCD